MTKLSHGDKLTELSTGHIWQITGQTRKGGLPHFTVSCRHPGRSQADLLLCESGLLMRFSRPAYQRPSSLFSLDRLTRLVRPFS